MLEPNSQSAPARVSRVRRVKDLSLRLLEAQDTRLNRPVGVAIIAAIYFIVGGLLLPGYLALIMFLYYFIWELLVLLLALAAGSILAAIGVWRLRNWGLILVVVSSTVILLGTLSAAVQGSYLNMFFALAEAAILLYLAQPRIRARFT